MPNVIRTMVASLLVVLGLSQVGHGYSILTHEEIVDLLWADQMKPLLMQKFPTATEDELRKAHAYAYGRLATRCSVTLSTMSAAAILWMRCCLNPLT
jgi:hypothetical protein